jgi:hypothetical protein
VFTTWCPSLYNQQQNTQYTNAHRQCKTQGNTHQTQGQIIQKIRECVNMNGWTWALALNCWAPFECPINLQADVPSTPQPPSYNNSRQLWLHAWTTDTPIIWGRFLVELFLLHKDKQHPAGVLSFDANQPCTMSLHYNPPLLHLENSLNQLLPMSDSVGSNSWSPSDLAGDGGSVLLALMKPFPGMCNKRPASLVVVNAMWI